MPISDEKKYRTHKHKSFLIKNICYSVGTTLGKQSCGVLRLLNNQSKLVIEMPTFSQVKHYKVFKSTPIE